MHSEIVLNNIAMSLNSNFYQNSKQFQDINMKASLQILTYFFSQVNV